MAEEKKLKLVKVVNEDLIKTLAYLQTMAMNNQIHGIAATVYSEEYRHKIVVSGAYLTHPHTAMRPQEVLGQQIKILSEDKEHFEVVRL